MRTLRPLHLLAALWATALLSIGACSGSDGASGDDAGTDASVGSDADFCEQHVNAHVGDPCGPVTSTMCFPMCATGGCWCQRGPDGKGVWQCQSDFSCYPDASPLADTGAPPEDASDGASDDGGDASSDAPDDAPVDAPDDGG